MARNFLPPGFRFHPTDVELVMYYLKRKILGKKLHFEAIPEINLYKFPPWDLPDKSFLKTKDREWYFFCPTEKKYASGVRMNRATETGYWKTTGRDRPVQYKENVVGRVRTLIFHLGSAPHGKRTDWVIHEYKMEAESLAANEVAMEAYVLCKVFHKNGPGPKNGSQYGALFEEEDWNEDCEIPLYPSLPVGPCPSLPTVEVHKNHKSSAAPGSSMVQASKDALWNGERLSYVSSAVELQKNQNSSGMVDPSHSPVSSMVQASRQDALLNGECLSYVSGAVELQKNQNSSGMVDPSHSPVSSMVQASRQDALLNGECLSYVTGPAELQKNQNFSGMVDLSHSPVSSMVQASRQDALLNGERLSYVTGTAELQKYQNSSAALSMVDLSHSPGSSMVQASREDAFLNGERLSIVTSTVNPANTSGLSSREAYPSLSTHSAQDMILDRDHLDIVHLLASFDADPMHFTRNANNEAHLDSGRETQLVPNSNLNDPFSGLDDLDGLANLNSGGLDFSGTEFVELDDLNAPLNWGSRVGGMLSNGFYSPCNFTGYVLPEITQSTFSVYDPHPRPADLHQLPFGFDSSEILENSTVVPMGQIYQPSYPRDCSNLTPYQPEENRKRKRLLPKPLFCRWSVEQDCSSEHFLNTPTIVGVLCC